MTAWFLLSVLLMLAFRLPFAAVPILPYYLAFDPGWCWMAVCGVLWGPAAAWGAVAAVLAGDAITGMLGPLTVFKVLAAWTCTLSAAWLWEPIHADHPGSRPATPDLRSMVRLLVVSVPGFAAASAWIGLGGELLGLYPFPYMTMIAWIHGLTWLVALAPPLYLLFARAFEERWFPWRQEAGAEDAMKPDLRTAFVLWVSGIGAPVLGMLAADFFYRIRPWHAFVLGVQAGVAVPAFTIPLLLIHLLAVHGVFRHRLPPAFWK
jgi:hypothetical protein